MSRKLVIGLSLTIVLLFLVILGLPLISNAMSFPQSTALSDKRPIDPFAEEIEWYQEELKRNDLSDETRKLLVEKLATTELMATQRANGLLTQPTRSSTASPTREVAVTILPDGIKEDLDVPLLPQDVVTIINAWSKTTPEHTFLIYAGFLTQNPQQGAIMIFHPRMYTFQYFNTPQTSGSIKIVDEKDTVIVLQSTNGVVFFFDFIQEVFVDSEGEVIPTVIPGRSATATPFPAYP